MKTPNNHLRLRLASRHCCIATPIKFEVCPVPIYNGIFTPPNCRDPQATRFNMVTLELRNREKDEWAICFAGCCFSKKTLEFEHESLPSDRSDDYLADTRFASRGEALDFWWEHYGDYVKILIDSNPRIPLAEWVPTKNSKVWELKRYSNGHKSLYFEETE